MKESSAAIALLFLSGVVNGFGQITMRWGGRSAAGVPFSLQHFGHWASASRWWIVGLFVCWSSGLSLAFLVRSIRLFIALPIFAGMTYVLTVLGAVALLGERPSIAQYAGLAMIFAGTMLILVRQ